MIRITHMDLSDTTHRNVFTSIDVPDSLLPEFKIAIRRACHTWQDMSPEFRDFYDRLLEQEHIVGSNMKEGINNV